MGGFCGEVVHVVVRDGLCSSDSVVCTARFP